MIGFYNYTMIMTYMSLLSAGLGIVVSLSGSGHPFVGVFFLLFCGLCDAFDGKLARTKKDRTQTERNFGIQIDSLSDLVAFGVLPVCIGAALIRRSKFLYDDIFENQLPYFNKIITALLFTVMILYILAAMIRLAYFNVTEEERQKTEGGVRKYYTGLPVTSAALIFPTVCLLHYLLPMDITPVYFGVMCLTGVSFLLKFNIRKPGLRSILVMIAIGLVEFVVMILFRRFSR